MERQQILGKSILLTSVGLPSCHYKTVVLKLCTELIIDSENLIPSGGACPIDLWLSPQCQNMVTQDQGEYCGRLISRVEEVILEFPG